MKEHIESYDKWLKGQSSKEEFHELQKRGLDDPFIGDALEGVELHHKSERSHIRTNLDKKLSTHKAQPIKPAKVRNLWPYAIAAGLALLFSSVFFLRNNEPLLETADVVNRENSEQIGDEIVALQVEPLKPSIDQDKTPEQEAPKKLTAKPAPKSIVTAEETQNDDLATITVEQESEARVPDFAKVEDAVAINEAPPEVMANEGESMRLPEASADQIIMSVTNTDQPKEELIKSKDQGLSQIAKKSQDGKAALMQKTTSLTRSQTPTVYPEIGEEAFKTILINNPFPKDALFMRGLKKGDSIAISFGLDKNGIPTNIDSGGFELDNIKKILKESGKWVAPENSGRINYQLPLYSL